MNDRYRRIAGVYDLVSGEPVYRVGRRRGIELLQLSAGACVLDVGCGTGLNFPGLRQRLGPEGRIVGLDASPQMLARARRRAGRVGPSNVRLLCADASTVTSAEILSTAGRPVDAVIATYSLSLMSDRARVWETLLELTSSRLALCVVDMQRPTRGGWVARWLAELACALGGADIDAHPWTLVERDCIQVSRVEAWGGHVQVRVGLRLG